MKTKDLYPRAMVHACPRCGLGVHQLAADFVRCSGAVNFPQTCSRTWESVEAFNAEAARCWDCEAPLEPDDVECCKGCAARISALRQQATLSEAESDLDAANTVYRGLELAGQKARQTSWPDYVVIDRLRRAAYQAVEACWDVLLVAQKAA